MQQTTFSRINTCTAWLMFAIAAIVYGLTIEPTASLWDCPEFIACGYKLEIGHPPGAPVFMLAANLFSQLTHHLHPAADSNTRGKPSTALQPTPPNSNTRSSATTLNICIRTTCTSLVCTPNDMPRPTRTGWAVS